jgi:hypothetical protein
VRPRQIRNGGYPSSLQVNGDLETKSRDGCTGLHTELSEAHRVHEGLYWFKSPKSKTIRPVWGFYCLYAGMKKIRCAQKGALGRLIDLWTRISEVGGPRILVGYNMESYLYELQLVSCDIRIGGCRRTASCVLSCP